MFGLRKGEPSSDPIYFFISSGLEIRISKIITSKYQNAGKQGVTNWLIV